MSCPECKCKVTYPYHEDEFYTDIGMQRCSACGYIFYDEMADEDDEDYLEPEYE